MLNHADIVGENLDNSMIRELNHRLEAVKVPFASEREHPSKIIITHMGASIGGTKKENSYLQIEFILKGFEFTPMLTFAPLKGSKYHDIGVCNKDFLKFVSTEARNVIEDYCHKLAGLLTFVGPKATVEQSLVASIESIVDLLHVKSLKVYSFDTIMKGVTFLMEIDANIQNSDAKLLIITSWRDAIPSEGDLYAEIDDSMIGSLKDVLGYESKAELISFCKKLSTLYAAAISVFDIDMESLLKSAK